MIDGLWQAVQTPGQVSSELRNERFHAVRLRPPLSGFGTPYFLSFLKSTCGGGIAFKAQRDDATQGGPV